MGSYDIQLYFDVLQDNVNERDLIGKLENEVDKVTSSMEEGGHRLDDITFDPAALNTELVKKDRELNAKVRKLTFSFGLIVLLCDAFPFYNL